MSLMCISLKRPGYFRSSAAGSTPGRYVLLELHVVGIRSLDDEVEQRLVAVLHRLVAMVVIEELKAGVLHRLADRIEVGDRLARVGLRERALVRIPGGADVLHAERLRG